MGVMYDSPHNNTRTDKLGTYKFKMAQNVNVVFIMWCAALFIHAGQVMATDDDVVIDQPFVQTARATIRGKLVVVAHPQLGADFRRGVAVYTGLPFAEPPLADLRYARPVPKVIEGDFDATNDDVVGCMQHKTPLMYPEGDTTVLQEDCLILDVYVPEPKPESAAVMVWIHGGGYHYGAKAHARARPTAMAALRDVIVVTANYRLGLLGFLSTGDDAIPGNLGLLDQRQALVWVQENIAAFGGDPNRMTIFGQSAGSGSVNAHLLSPQSAGLFSGVIMQSGAFTPTWAFKPLDEIKALTFAFGAAIGCEGETSRELVTCLRQKPADDIKEILDGGMSQMLYGVAPVADGEFLPADPMRAQAEGSFNPARVMIGCLRDEGNIFAMPPFLGREGYAKASFNRTEFRDNVAFQAKISDPLILDVMELLYTTPEWLNEPNADLVDSLTQFGGDRIILCPTFSTALELAGAVALPAVYTYLMTHEPAHSLWGRNYTWLGATHGEDLPYVMGTPFIAPSGDEESADDWFIWGRFADDEVDFAHQIMKYWTNFAKTGDPNLSSLEDRSADHSLPAWHPFSAEDQQYKVLSRDLGDAAVPLPNARECHFQIDVLPSLIERAEEMARLKELLEEKNVAESSSTCDDTVSNPEL